jgi:Asp-tRNA(Asn)/Glu-tRNA(Gln) amidotransferase C subunit
MTENNRTREDGAIANENTAGLLNNTAELEDRFIVIPNVL